MLVGNGRRNLNCNPQETPTTSRFNGYVSDLCCSEVKAHPPHALLQRLYISIQRLIDYVKIKSNNFTGFRNSNKKKITAMTSQEKIKPNLAPTPVKLLTPDHLLWWRSDQPHKEHPVHQT